MKQRGSEDPKRLDIATVHGPRDWLREPGRFAIAIAITVGRFDHVDRIAHVDRVARPDPIRSDGTTRGPLDDLAFAIGPTRRREPSSQGIRSTNRAWNSAGGRAGWEALRLDPRAGGFGCRYATRLDRWAASGLARCARRCD